MTAEVLWALFCATGAPEYYLLYKKLQEHLEQSEESCKTA